MERRKKRRTMQQQQHHHHQQQQQHQQPRLMWHAIALVVCLSVVPSLAFLDERPMFEAKQGDSDVSINADTPIRHQPSIPSVECQYWCSSSNSRQSEASSCPPWCRKMSLMMSALVSSSSSKSIISDRLRGHWKRQVDMDDVGTSTEDETSNMSAGGNGQSAVSRVSVVVKATKRNALEAIVEWHWTQVVASARPYNFVLHWARDTCNLDERYPHCDDPDTYYSKTVPWRNSPQNNFTITNVTYNSKYWVQIEYDDWRSHKVLFTTPGCSNPADRTFKRCLAASAQTTTGLSDDVNFRIDVTRLQYDQSVQMVRATLKWRLLDDGEVNASNWESTILVSHHTVGGVHMEVVKTSADETTVFLKPDKLYEITVKASTDHKDVIYQTLYLNTSRDYDDSKQSATADCKDDCNTTTIITPGQLLDPMTNAATFHPLILAIAVLGVVAMTTMALLCVKRCRAVQSKFLKKTILSKSNSYKATPGTPRLPKEEQLQMILKTDDWELDARDVILGAEVGQGAFGLVMTGFYQNVQVAIKVLKGDVLPSYRDELLREIALMKRIGKHPNIVSLIGACTIRDPIALIMEYMPFGNLQAFLQKCRVEGGLRRKETGAEVEYCPLDELNGTKEFWILTSTDMLSFARQVAVAMEFLTDRKYVHRDLAARNVLVGQNKVVKLCDFGLARLVYNGDQYCKLTNGRLPLKWMALESIRDRVFTAQSDVWSYGVLLWEIATLGCSPYSNIALVDLYRLLTEGYRMEQPRNCSSELYDIMSQCWHENPSNRPTFGEIRSQLDNMLSQHRNYLDLDCLDPSNGIHVRSYSPTDAAYTSSSGIDLFPSDDFTPNIIQQSKTTSNGNKTDNLAVCEDPWDPSIGMKHRWNSGQEEDEEFGYLRSAEIANSVAKEDLKRPVRDDDDVCVHLL